jgi:multicomponent Na+:H+ antiporter subunit A
MVPEVLAGNVIRVEIPWISGLGCNLALYIDGLSLLLGLVSSGFGSLAILYSVEDMKGEVGLGRYYMLMLLFLGSMVSLVFSGNLLLLYISWEIVGICSYGLIGFFLEQKESSWASYKAMMMTHVGGFGLLIGIIMLFVLTGTFDLPAIASRLQGSGLAGVAVPIIIGLFLVAVIAKSVQFPLHTWLPDATAAPSPVTAFLHAAAMVKAGVYLVARMYTIFTPFTSSITTNFAISTIGVVTLTVASLAALAQRDIKRLLAYSTISQIGYMILALGLGTTLGAAAGLFHLLNHAMFKGLLFLCAGCLIYATKTKDLNQMGGLAKNMPITAAVTIIGALAVSGIPPLNGFASKLMIYEAILEIGMKTGGAVGGIYIFYCILALLASAVTLAYSMKLVYGAFFGLRPERLKEVKEVHPVMYIPLCILASICIIFGVAPQAPLNFLINPAVESLTGSRVIVITLGYLTNIGFYQATLITFLIAVSIGIGLLLYYNGIRITPPAPVEGKYGVFTGGEIASPYIELDKVRVNGEPFVYAADRTFGPFYKFMWNGGMDIFYMKFVHSIQGFCDNFKKTHTGSLSAYLSVFALFMLIILTVLFTR